MNPEGKEFAFIATKAMKQAIEREDSKIDGELFRAMINHEQCERCSSIPDINNRHPTKPTFKVTQGRDHKDPRKRFRKGNFHKNGKKINLDPGDMLISADYQAVIHYG
ncbi:MAG: hypothetical protein V5A57_01260 [Candidatus Paceibacterota bacterium]